jgi:hypothetical protein
MPKKYTWIIPHLLSSRVFINGLLLSCVPMSAILPTANRHLAGSTRAPFHTAAGSTPRRRRTAHAVAPPPPARASART